MYCTVIQKHDVLTLLVILFPSVPIKAMMEIEDEECDCSNLSAPIGRSLLHALYSMLILLSDGIRDRHSKALILDT